MTVLSSFEAGDPAGPVVWPVSAARYSDRQILGRGGCGVVTAARDHQLDRDVAVKRLVEGAANNPELRRRFLTEAKITAMLQHPGIVPIHEVGHRPDGTLFYAMKLLEGKTFAEVIAQRRQAASRSGSVDFELLEPFLDVCDAVAFAHRRSIIHRDLKPGNVMIGPCGETVVVDWGLAKSTVDEGADALPDFEEAATVAGGSRRGVSGSQSSPPRTRYGAVIGTPGYMSPEQARGDVGRLGPTSDVFSLGAMLYEILVGASPFPEATTAHDLIRATVEHRWRSPAEANRRCRGPLASICAKAMAAGPHERYADAGELAADLRRYLADEPVTAHRETSFERLRRWCRRNAKKATATVAAVALVAVISSVSAVLVHRAHRAERRAHAAAREALRAEAEARAAAERAHLKALERLETARSATDAWLVDLSGSLQFYPGLRPVRDDLLAQAERTYDRLLASLGTSAELPQDRLERARCLTRLGDARLLRGKSWEAGRCFEAALKELGAIPIADAGSVSPANAAKVAGLGLAATGGGSTSAQVLKLDLETVRTEKLNNRIGLALVALARGDGDGSADADRETARAEAALADTCTAMLSSGAVSTMQPDGRAAVARGLLTLARLSTRRGDFASAVERLTAARSIAESLVASRGSAADYQRLETVLDELALSYREDGQLRPAVATWQDLVALYEGLIDKRGNRPDWIQGQALVQTWVATTQQLEGDLAAAKNSYETAVAGIREGWERIHGDHLYSETTAVAHANLGKLAFRTGDVARGEETLRQAIDELRALIATQGADPDWFELLGNFYTTLGQGIALHDLDRGLEQLQEADHLFVTLRGEMRLSQKAERHWASALLSLAQIRGWRQEHDAAASLLETAAGLIDDPVADQVEATHRRSLRWRIAFAQGVVARARGEDSTAATHFAGAIDEASRQLSGREATAAHPLDAECYLTAARLVLFCPDPDYRDPRRASRWLRDARSCQPTLATDASWWQLQAIAAQQSGSLTEARDAIGRAIALRQVPSPLDRLISRSLATTSGEAVSPAAGKSSDQTEPTKRGGVESLKAAVERALQATPGDEILRGWLTVQT